MRLLESSKLAPRDFTCYDIMSPIRLAGSRGKIGERETPTLELVVVFIAFSFPLQVGPSGRGL